MASNYEKSEYFKSLMLSMLTGHATLNIEILDTIIEKAITATSMILDAAQAVYELEDDVNEDDPLDDGGFRDVDEEENWNDHFDENGETIEEGNADFWTAPPSETRISILSLMNRLNEWREQNPDSAARMDEARRAIDSINMSQAQINAYMRQGPMSAEEAFLQRPVPPESRPVATPLWMAVDPATDDPPIQTGPGLIANIEANTHTINIDLSRSPVDMLREMTERTFGDHNPITPEQEAQMDQLESDWTNQIPPSTHPPPRHRSRPDEGQPQCGW